MRLSALLFAGFALLVASAPAYAFWPFDAPLNSQPAKEAPTAAPVTPPAKAIAPATPPASSSPTLSPEALKAQKDAAAKEEAARKAQEEAAKKAKEEADKKEKEKQEKEAKTIAGYLNTKGNFKTLLSLFEAAKITTLKSSGNYTIFAPTDEAFAKSRLNIEDLKKPEHADELRSLLGYHMVNGNFLLKKVIGSTAAPNALEGEVLNIDGTTKPPKIEKAHIVGEDIQPTNGTIYIIDDVLVPPSMLAPPPPPPEKG